MQPEAFLHRMQEMLGDEYEAFSAGFGQENFQALRVNPLKYAELWASGEGRRLFHLTPVSWEKNGYYYDRETQPGRHPYHEAGVYYIQEPSAMVPVNLMEIQSGDKVLDLCAAPGGKSTQIAAALRGKGLLVSNEIHPARAKILSENIERMGVQNSCVTNETPARLSEKFPEYFDRILVDAPCSGEGMFRKNPTACEEWSPKNVELCAARQGGILDCAAGMLRPGGRLVYSTCTFAPQENEGSVSHFLKRHPEFELLPIDKAKLGIPEIVCDGRPEWAEYPHDSPDGGTEGGAAGACGNLCHTLRLWPHQVKGEGHFAAVFQKQGSVPEGYSAMPAGGLEPGISPKERELDPWWEFAREVLGVTSREGKTRLLRFGDNLYAAPDCMPELKGLKVLRPGLHLGTLKRNRFEPAHALALALPCGGIRHVCQLSAEDGSAEAYLRGQTFSMEGEKGWYLICVNGFSLGWGKLAGGVMKNHYPKGLRRV